MRTRPLLAAAVLSAAAGIAALGCGGATTASAATSPTTPTTGGTGSGGTVDTSSMYGHFGGAATVSLDGTTGTIRTTDVPNHPTPYWGAANPMYEPPQAGMMPNGFTLVAQNLILRIPLAPKSAAATDTPLGPIGVAVNGVVFYNQYAAGRQPLGMEILSFDRYNGHPTPAAQYHYHFEPLWITAASKSRLIGVLLDGFPVYGPQDSDGRAPTDLDSCHGHVAVTPEFASGIYHYHTSDTVPYIAGCYRGTPGTIG
jgi:YHYH protein